MSNYTREHIPASLIEEIILALKAASPYGSIEIFVQDDTITQITVRTIKKTQVPIASKIGASESDSRTTVRITAHAKTM